MEFKSPPACSTFGEALALQIHSSFALPLASSGSSFDAVCWLVPLSQALPNGMVPECGSMLNHHLAGLLGLGCLSWAGHQIHVALPVNKLLDSGSSKDIPLPQVHFEQ